MNISELTSTIESKQEQRKSIWAAIRNEPMAIAPELHEQQRQLWLEIEQLEQLLAEMEHEQRTIELFDDPDYADWLVRVHGSVKLPEPTEVARFTDEQINDVIDGIEIQYGKVISDEAAIDALTRANGDEIEAFNLAWIDCCTD